MSNVVFVTGNQNKADHLARLLGIPIDHQKIDLDEIQSVSLEEIVTHKLHQAYVIAGKPVMVEDVSLGFNALAGLPGPFIKFFVDLPNGLEILCRMLDGFSDRSATAQCTFGYYDGVAVTILIGKLDGSISMHPLGSGGYGWDSIFCPAGHNGKTSAELSPAEYDVIYKKIKALDALREILQDRAAA